MNDIDDINDLEETLDEFWEKAEAILPGTFLGCIDIVNGVTSSTILASYEKNKNGDYDIFVVYDPEGDYSIDPECEVLGTVKKKNFNKWLKSYGIEEHEELLPKEEGGID